MPADHGFDGLGGVGEIVVQCLWTVPGLHQSLDILHACRKRGDVVDRVAAAVVVCRAGNVKLARHVERQEERYRRHWRGMALVRLIVGHWAF